MNSLKNQNKHSFTTMNLLLQSERNKIKCVLFCLSKTTIGPFWGVESPFENCLYVKIRCVTLLIECETVIVLPHNLLTNAILLYLYYFTDCLLILRKLLLHIIIIVHIIGGEPNNCNLMLPMIKRVLPSPKEIGYHLFHTQYCDKKPQTNY